MYHLLGRLSASPTYVISDEDMLEFICALQSEHLTPEKLFHELEHSHLLLIGSAFTNWLARLFLRMAKRHRLSDPRDVGEVLADDHTGQDARLMAFLQQVSVRTRVYGGAERFVDELHRRWMARQKPDASRPPLPRSPSASCRPSARCPTTPSSSAMRAKTLRRYSSCKAGWRPRASNAWFDMERLEGGDDYDRKIRATSRAAPSSSRSSRRPRERRLEAYFRREWSYAIDRSRNMADGALFILPVCVDDTDCANGARAREVQGRCTSRAF